MLRSLSYLILLAGVSALFPACDEDAFSQLSTIEVPEHDPLTAMSLALTNGDTVLFPYIGQSRGITDDEPQTGPTGSLTLTQNGNVISEGNYTTGSEQTSFEGFRLEVAQPITALPGDVFQLNGTVEGLGMATATQVMPTVPRVEIVSYTPDGAIDGNGERVNELIFDIIDSGETADSYAFKVTSRFINGFDCPPDIPEPEPEDCDTIFTEQNRFLESFDPLAISTYDFSLVLPDGAFNGDTYRFRLLFYRDFDDELEGTELFLRVYNLTEDGLRYVRSRTAFEDARFDPFSEPVNVHDNIENGYGFFMVSNVVELSIQ